MLPLAPYRPHERGVEIFAVGVCVEQGAVKIQVSNMSLWLIRSDRVPGDEHQL
jgi:hypothetical protein